MGDVSEKDLGSFFQGLGHHLSVSREARQELAPAKDVASFFDGLGYYVRVSREARQALASAVAESFSVFDYIEPDENRLSTIIADLLDPKGKHGQGSTFLAAFLKQLEALGCKIPSHSQADLDGATVVNEATTSFLTSAARRIDIRIELPHRFGIGIENKPWAGEQELAIGRLLPGP